MRKVLSFTLVLALILGSLGMAFAADPAYSDVADKPCEQAVTTLTQLGVVTGYPDGQYKPDNIVTRAEMAALMIRALGLQAYAVGVSTFPDMDQAPWAQKHVAYASALGIVVGYPDGTFRPNNTVNYNEATTMVLRALGYTDKSLVGVWPTNYVNKATALGVLNNVPAKGGTTGAVRSDIAIMTYNALFQQIGKVDENNTFIPTNTGTLLAPVYDFMITRLGAVWTPPTLITKAIADDATFNMLPYVGAEASYFVDKDGNPIAVDEVSTTFITGELNAALDKFTAVDGTKYDVLENLALTNFNGFVNMDQRPAWVPVAKTYTLAAEVSGLKIKDVFSVLDWVVTADFQYEAGMLTDKKLNGHELPLDDSNKFNADAMVLEGADALDKIAADSVVYVYTYGNVPANEVVKVQVGTKTVEGTVSARSATGDEITIDGKVYEYASDNLGVGLASGSIALKDNVVLYLDYYGYIYDADINPGGGNFGILLQKENKGSLSAPNALAEIFQSNGEAKTYAMKSNLNEDEAVVANRIIDAGQWVDGNLFGGGVDAANRLALLDYSTDKNGVVDYVKELPTFIANVKLHDTGYYDGFKVDSNVVIFTFNGGAWSDADNYGITTFDKMKGKTLNAAYYLDGVTIKAMVVAGGVEDTYGVYNNNYSDIASPTNEMMTVQVDGVAVTAPATVASIAAATESPGNLFKINRNAAGTIVGMTAIIAGDPEEVAPIAPSFAATSSKVDIGGIEYTIEAGSRTYEWDAVDGKFKAGVATTAASVANKPGGVWALDTNENGVADTFLVF
ncbi:MAG TPA: S-layer homology domain-containing protein [Clostridiales bacterium]|nr:S-layer homology domain-containing protein [Clostridiales bacterium]